MHVIKTTYTRYTSTNKHIISRFYCKFHFVHVSPVVKVAKITRMK